MKVISVLLLAFALVAAQNVTETKPTATQETGSISNSASESHVIIITTQPVTATASVSNSASQQVSTTYAPTTTSHSESASVSHVLTFSASASESQSNVASTVTPTSNTNPTPVFPDLNGKWAVSNVVCAVALFDSAFLLSNLNQANASVYSVTPVTANVTTFVNGLLIEDHEGYFYGFTSNLVDCKGKFDASNNTANIVCQQGATKCNAILTRGVVVPTQPTHSTEQQTTSSTPSTIVVTHSSFTETSAPAPVVPNIAGTWDSSNIKGANSDKIFDSAFTVTAHPGNNTLFTFTPVHSTFQPSDVLEQVDGTVHGISGSLAQCTGKIDFSKNAVTLVCSADGSISALLTKQTPQPSVLTHTATYTTETGKAVPTDTTSGAAVVAVSFMLVAVALF